MPIYEYLCDSCGHEFDTLRSVSEKPLVECPLCKKPSLHKKLSAAAFHLKGTGWYKTDFRDKQPAAPQDSKEQPKADAPKTDSAVQKESTKKDSSSGSAASPASSENSASGAGT